MLCYGRPFYTWKDTKCLKQLRIPPHLWRKRCTKVLEVSGWQKRSFFGSNFKVLMQVIKRGKVRSWKSLFPCHKFTSILLLLITRGGFKTILQFTFTIHCEVKILLLSFSPRIPHYISKSFVYGLTQLQMSSLHCVAHIIISLKQKSQSGREREPAHEELWPWNDAKLKCYLPFDLLGFKSLSSMTSLILLKNG